MKKEERRRVSKVVFVECISHFLFYSSNSQKHFKNKEEMLFEICRKAVDDLIETLHAVEKDSHDPAECLRKMLVAQTAIMITKRKKESKILFEEHYWIRGEKKKLISKTQREVYDLYMKKCKELERKGLLNDIDLTVLNFSIFGIVFWFFRWGP